MQLARTAISAFAGLFLAICQFNGLLAASSPPPPHNICFSSFLSAAAAANWQSKTAFLAFSS
jgi:hypothetical protein